MQHNGWHRALDTQMDLLKWHKTRIGELFTQNFHENILTKDNQGTPDQIISDATTLTRNVTQTLWRADTMYVTSDMQHIMLQAAHDLPDDYRFDMHEILCPTGFCLFEENMYGEDKSGVTMAISAMTWYQILHNDEKVLVLGFWSPTHDPSDKATWDFVSMLHDDNIPVPPLSLCHYFMLPDGQDCRPGKNSGYPQGSELVDGILTLFAALNILSHQTIGEPVKMPLDRATRKRYQRDFRDAPERMITLITLRRKSASKPDPDAPPVPWSRRWIVRGHWRKQPDKTGWHWKYIYEYVKGPENKPLIITERRVFNFKR
jgi:hypothetical protein